MKEQIKSILLTLGLDEESVYRLFELNNNQANGNENKNKNKNKKFHLSGETQALLNLLIEATFDLRKYEKEVLLLQNYVLKNEKNLSEFDRGRFHHIRGYISWRIHNSIFFAYEFLNRSLKILLRLKTKEASGYMARVYDTYGQLLRTQGLLEDARLEFEKSLTLRQKSDDITGKALTLGNLGRLNLEMGNYEKAKDYLLEDLEIVTDKISTDKNIHAQLLNTISICSTELKQFEEAQQYLNKSYEINSSSNNKTGLCFNHLAWAGLYVANGDIEKSQEHIERAKLILEQQNFPEFLRNDIKGDLFHLTADIHHIQKQNKKAVKYYRKAVKLFESSSSVSPIAKAKLLHSYAKVLKEIGFVAEANERYREALRHIDLSEDEQCRQTISQELKSQNKDSWLLHTAGRFIGHKQIDFLLNEAGKKGFRGENKKVVVLFSDIRDFTSISEKLSPEEIISFLNEFFGLMTKCIESNNGFIDKFIGDEIMAIFSVQDDSPEMIRQAVEDASVAALMMLTELDRINRKLSGKVSGLRIGTGLHYGQVVAGLIGSPQKRSYTFMGDVVNTASRIEGMAKQLGANILVTDEVYSNYSADNKFLLIPLGKYQPKGKDSPLLVSELVGIDDNSVDAKIVKKEIDEVNECLKLFYARDFKKAKDGFLRLYNEHRKTQRAKGYKFLYEKAKNFVAEPPDENWTGEIRLFSK